MAFGWVHLKEVQKKEKRAGESKAAFWRAERSSAVVSEVQKELGPCPPPLPSFPGEETFLVGVPGEGPTAAVGPFVF